MRKYGETILKFHTVNPSRLAFGGARPDSLNIETAETPLASAVVTRRIRETQPTQVNRFLTEFHKTQLSITTQHETTDSLLLGE